jgi:hypothetical protein
MSGPRADAVVVPLDVAAQWWSWLNSGHAERVREDLGRLLATTRPASSGTDPPSTPSGPAISTR